MMTQDIRYFRDRTIVNGTYFVNVEDASFDHEFGVEKCTGIIDEGFLEPLRIECWEPSHRDRVVDVSKLSKRNQLEIYEHAFRQIQDRLPV